MHDWLLHSRFQFLHLQEEFSRPVGRCGGNHGPLTALETGFDVPGVFDLVYKDLYLVVYT